MALLHQPVVDLLPSSHAEFFSNAAAVAARYLIEDGAPTSVWIERCNPPGFRAAVLQATGRIGEAVSSVPLAALQEHVECWNRLGTPARIKAARVLLLTGEHARLRTLLTDDPSAAEEPILQLLGIAAARALSGAGLIMGLNRHRIRRDCFRLVGTRGLPKEVRVSATVTAFMLALESTGDRASCHDLYRKLLMLEWDLAADGHDFLTCVLRSRIWRASALWPLANGDLERMRDEMECAESLAIEARPTSDLEVFLRRESLFSLYESRTKEKLACADMDGALGFARRLVELFPITASARMDLAEVLQRRAEYPEAAAQYALAASLGPPGAGMAYFMAGECFSRGGADGPAQTCYRLSQRHEPQGSWQAIVERSRVKQRMALCAPMAMSMLRR